MLPSQSRRHCTKRRIGQAIVLSLVAGFQVMRQMVGLSALSKSKPEALIKILAPLLEQLIRGQSADRHAAG
jgi:hypothetical protein